MLNSYAALLPSDQGMQALTGTYHSQHGPESYCKGVYSWQVNSYAALVLRDQGMQALTGTVHSQHGQPLDSCCKVTQLAGHLLRKSDYP